MKYICNICVRPCIAETEIPIDEEKPMNCLFGGNVADWQPSQGDAHTPQGVGVSAEDGDTITCPKHPDYTCTRIWNPEGTFVIGHYCPICTGLVKEPSAPEPVTIPEGGS